MGNYLSRRRPPPPSPALLGQDQPARPDRLWPAHPVCVPPVEQFHSAAPALELAHRLSSEDHVTSACRRRRLFVTVQRKRYPVWLDRCFFMGVFSSAPRSGYLKPALSAGSSKMFCTSVILKTAPTKDNSTLRLALKQTVVYMWSSLSAHLPNTSVTLIRALEEGNKMRAKEDLTALGESRKAMVKQEEDHIVPKRQGNRRSGSDGNGRGQSAFKPLLVNGALSSFVPKPGLLKGDLRSKNSEDSLVKKYQPSFRSSCSKRNAITSSYSSTRGFLSLQTRSGAGATRHPGPVSSHSQASEEGHFSGSSGGSVSGRQIQGEKVSDSPSGQKQNLRNCSPTNNSARPRKRKIPLLLPDRRRDPLILPAPLQLGYRITAEDLDLEKRAAIQWINKVLKDDGAKTQSN